MWNNEPSDLWNAQKIGIVITDDYKKSGKYLSSYNDLIAQLVREDKTFENKKQKPSGTEEGNNTNVKGLLKYLKTVI